jgi:Mn2+/Fe2+ NRAMP family transporter
VPAEGAYPLDEAAGTAAQVSRVGHAGARWRWARWTSGWGPGVVSGAADNDPTTVGTAVSVGATTGYQLSWLAVVVFPILAVVQVVAAHVGSVGGADLQELAARRFGRGWSTLLMVSVVAVNVLTIAADLEAGAAAGGLLLHIDWRWLALPFAGAVMAGLVVGTFQQVQRVLKYLTLLFFAYAATAVMVRPRWAAVARATFVPAIHLDRAVVTGALALVGTTLTSYVFMWETVGQAEASRARALQRNLGAAGAAVKVRWGTRADALAGTAVTAAACWCILVGSAATLGGDHHAPVATAVQAAAALRPLAGRWAGDLFAAGLLASAAIALPVLIACTGYVVGAQLDLRRGLSVGFAAGRWFYAVLGLAVALGAALSLAGVPPIAILVAASVAGGLGAPVSLALLLLVARDSACMHGRPISGGMAAAGWAVATAVSLLGLAFLVASLAG